MKGNISGLRFNAIHPRKKDGTFKYKYNAKAIDDENDKFAAKLFTKGIAIVCLALLGYIIIFNPLKVELKTELLNAFISADTVHAEVPIATSSPTPSPRAEFTGDETPRQYLENSMTKAGFSSQKISFMERIIGECENGTWDPKRIHTNTDGTIDAGVMQINAKWHKARFEHIYGPWDTNIFNYKKNIDYAVNEIMAKQADFSAWAACSSKV